MFGVDDESMEHAVGVLLDETPLEAVNPILRPLHALDSREGVRNATILGPAPSPLPAFVARPVEPGSDAQP